jgi:hypothetical protein
MYIYCVNASLRSIESCIMQAVRQVIFTDVLIVGRLDVDAQSFAPNGLHKTDAASDWLLNAHKTALLVVSPFEKINRITAAIGVILAITGSKMFYFY